MNNEASALSSANESRIILLTSIGHALCHISELAFAAVIPVVMGEFGLMADQAALLAVPGFALLGIGAIPAGIWADYRGSREALTGYYILVFAACLSIYFAESAWALCAGLTFLGAAISIYHPVGLAMLSHGCVNRGRAMGINGVAGSLGVALGPALGLYMVSHYSWRDTYALIALLSLIGLLCSVCIRIELPSHHAAARGSSSNTSNGKSLRVLVLLFLAMLMGGFNYRCITTALPTYLSGLAGSEAAVPSTGDATGPRSSSESRANNKGSGIVFLVFALGGVGQLAGGYLADRFRPSLLYAITIAMTIPLALLIANTSVHLGTWFAGSLAIFMFAEQPLENTMVAEATPAKWRSTAYGLKFILTFGVASLGAYVAGWVWQYLGLVHVFDVYAISALIMAALALPFFIQQRRMRKAAQSAPASI